MYAGGFFSGLTFTTKQKPIKILRIYSGEIHNIFMAKTKGIFMGLTYENTIKKPWKIQRLQNAGPLRALLFYMCQNLLKNEV